METCISVKAHINHGDGMGRIDIMLPDDLEERLRGTVFRRKGMRKGNLKEAINEAITLWIEQGERFKAREDEKEKG